MKTVAELTQEQVDSLNDDVLCEVKHRIACCIRDIQKEQIVIERAKASISSYQKVLKEITLQEPMTIESIMKDPSQL